MHFNDLRRQYFLNKKKINKSILKVLNHGQFILGPEVRKLEDKLKKYVGVRYCLSVSSGTDALLMSLMALNIGKGDEVITPSFGYVSTVEVICFLGAKPILVDINKKTGLIDENLIQNRITKKTRAIIPVSLFGQIPNFSKINKISQSNGNISVIEDAAQSFGSLYNNKKSCSLSSIAITSFFPSKNLGSYGDGGAIFTKNKKLFDKLKQIRVHGQKNQYNHLRLGILGRMDTLQCSIVLEKFNLFNSELKKRKKIFSKYNNYFNNINKKGIEILKENKFVDSNCHQFCLIVDNREKLIDFLNIKQIPFKIYYPKPLNKHKPYLKYHQKGDNQNSMYLSKRIISIPMNAYLSVKEQNYIIKSFDLFINKYL